MRLDGIASTAHATTKTFTVEEFENDFANQAIMLNGKKKADPVIYYSGSQQLDTRCCGLDK